MRVRYGDLRASERRQLALVDARIQSLYRGALEAARDSAWWKAALSGVHRKLSGERWDDGRVVVRSETRNLTPLVERVVAAAPRGLDVLAGRPPIDVSAAVLRARRRTNVDLSRARFRAGFARGHLLDVVFHLPGGKGDEREQRAAEGLVWDALGERLADDWIGTVSVVAEPRGGSLRVMNEAREDEPARLDLDRLAATVQAAVRGVHEGLPVEPAWARPATEAWTMLELEPEAAPEWAAQDDLMITTTCEPEMLKCFLSGAPFSSVRFSRHAERYLYLKFAAEGELEDRLARRSEIEDALDRALTSGKAGRVVGGGLGVAYTYVDFIASDVERALELAIEVARAAALPERSWILPFDDELGAEWIEAVPGAPNPPGHG